MKKRGNLGGGGTTGWLSLDELSLLFGDPVIVGLLMREIPESVGAEEASSWLFPR